MTVRLSTTVRNIERTVSNPENVEIILRFFEFMKKIGTSSMYLKVIMEKLRHRIYDSINPSLLSYLNDKLDPKWRKRKKVSPPIRENEFISFKPFHWKIDLYSQRDGFDIIIGNPPYVDSERMVKTAPKFRDVLSGVYASANGNWDLYIPFFERAMQITNDNGIVCFISPNKWLSIGYGKSMRQMLKPHISGLCNCDEIRVFSDAANSSVISFFNKRKLSESINIHYFDSSSSILKRNPTPRTILDIDNWGVLISEYLDTLLQIMNQKYQLDPDFCDVENPFTVSEAYDLVKVLYDGKPQENELKLVNTGTIDRFESLWGREKTTYIQMDYIYPFIQKNKLRKLMPYRYEQSCSPKIIITGIRYFESFLDKDGEYVAGKSTIIIRNGRMVPLEGINALLNSTLIGFYMREAFKATGIGGGTNFSSSMVESIPVPKLCS